MTNVSRRQSNFLNNPQSAKSGTGKQFQKWLGLEVNDQRDVTRQRKVLVVPHHLPEVDVLVTLFSHLPNYGVDSRDRMLGRLIGFVTEPDKIHRGVSIYVVHQCHLMTPFSWVLLVDTHGIYPEFSVSIRAPHTS